MAQNIPVIPNVAESMAPQRRGAAQKQAEPVEDPDVAAASDEMHEAIFTGAKVKTKEEEAAQAVKKDGESGVSTMVIIVFALVVIALIAIIVYMVLKQNEDKESEKEVFDKLQHSQMLNRQMHPQMQHSQQYSPQQMQHPHSQHSQQIHPQHPQQQQMHPQHPQYQQYMQHQQAIANQRAMAAARQRAAAQHAEIQIEEDSPAPAVAPAAAVVASEDNLDDLESKVNTAMNNNAPATKEQAQDADEALSAADKKLLDAANRRVNDLSELEDV